MTATLSFALMARREHDRLVREARSADDGTARTMAAYAGVLAAQHGLAVDCPFGPDESRLAECWTQARQRSADTPIPSPSVSARPWAPAPGLTHAARTAPQD